MATKEKGKKGKEFKSLKRVEEVIEEKRPENSGSETKDGETNESVCEEQSVAEEQPPQKETSPEPVYDEPVLPELIILRYEGEKVRGHYHGEGTSYFKGGHVYKGQFADGYMHGRGKYTWADGIEYEGDFFKNEVTGKGIYHWNNGSTYEGDVIQGKRHGYGTFRWEDKGISYTGQWNQGFRTGKGRVNYDENGASYYEGDFHKNLRHGWGMRQYPSGNLYKGMWFNNVRHGQGIMKWVDHNQIYTGQWENGIQHGMGQHIWLLSRIQGSQYAMRNMFDGEFVNGLRHGWGAFYYANGASYIGFWKDNMKHGKGKFMFKNGRVYEGIFEHDHIVEYPDFSMDASTTPDISLIRTRTPLPSDLISLQSNESRNTTSPNFQLEIDNLLNEFPEADREEEAIQVMRVITRHTSSLRKIYTFYSHLGYEGSPDNTFTMTRMQFWRFAKDCHFHHHGVMLTEMDCFIGKNFNRNVNDLHNPYERILQRHFINYLVIMAYQIYGKNLEDSSPHLAKCLSTLVTENILRCACNVKGYFYYETRRAVNALVYVERTYEIFQTFCKPRQNAPHEPVFKMREFIFLLKDLKLFNTDLTPKHVVKVLNKDDPNVVDEDECFNLEIEMTFLDFFEALIGCAEIYATDAVVRNPSSTHPSPSHTPEHSLYSTPAPPSHFTSQAGLEDGESAIRPTPRRFDTSPVLSVVSPRPVSSAAGTMKTTGEGSIKGTEAYTAKTSRTSGSDNVGSVHPSHLTSAQETGAGGADDHQPFRYSIASTGTQDGGHQANVEAGDDEEELDEETRRFNFWTHQVHVFFIHKFFQAAENLIMIKKLSESRYVEHGPQDEVKPPTPVSQDPIAADGDSCNPQVISTPSAVTMPA